MIKNRNYRDAMATYLFVHLILVDALVTVLALGFVYHQSHVLGNEVPWWAYVVVGVQTATFMWIVVALFIEFKHWVYRQWHLR